jgi:hypothetical protein
MSIPYFAIDIIQQKQDQINVLLLEAERFNRTSAYINQRFVKELAKLEFELKTQQLLLEKKHNLSTSDK